MIGYYKRSLIHLLEEVKRASIDPYCNGKIWYTVQLIIINKIIYLEQKIRVKVKEIKELNFQRKDPSNKLSKEESKRVKTKLNKLDKQIEDLRFVIKSYQSIGDAIAFTFINKFDIKPQNFKQSAGFISAKDGLKRELEIFKDIYKNDMLAIFNDITSVLKYADITFIDEDGTIPIEVKSSNFENSRVIRQRENAKKIFDYIDGDITENLYGKTGVTHRVNLKNKQKYYSKEVNFLIEKSKESGNSIIQVEKGQYYFVSRKFDYGFMNDNFSKLKNPVIISVNDYLFCGQGYYPFSLSISSPENYIDFLMGKYVIFQIIDLDILAAECNRNGYKFEMTNDSEYGFELLSNKKKEDWPIKISNHYFMRSVTEFVSIKCLIEESIESIESIKTLINK